MFKNKLDIIITSFLRPQALEDLLQSIYDYNPQLLDYITIGIQSKEKVENYKINGKEIKVIHQPWDCGLSYARNNLVKNTEREYILLLEDDFLFNSGTDIERMIFLLENNKDIGVVGGMVSEMGIEFNFNHRFELEEGGKRLRQVGDGDEWRSVDYYLGGKKITYKETGCVLNFAMFRRKIFQNHGWSNNQKLAEHTDFYYRWIKNIPNYKIVFCPDVKIDTLHTHSKGDYRVYKSRHLKYMKKFMKKNNLTHYIYREGFCYYLNPIDDKLYQTRENRDGKIL